MHIAHAHTNTHAHAHARGPGAYTHYSITRTRIKLAQKHTHTHTLPASQQRRNVLARKVLGSTFVQRSLVLSSSQPATGVLKVQTQAHVHTQSHTHTCAGTRCPVACLSCPHILCFSSHVCVHFKYFAFLLGRGVCVACRVSVPYLHSM